MKATEFYLTIKNSGKDSMDRFLFDIAKLWVFIPEHSDLLIESVIALLQAQKMDESKKEIRKNAVSQSRQDEKTVNSVLNALRYMAENLDLEEDPVDSFITDLNELGVITEDKKDTGITFFNKFFNTLMSQDKKRRLEHEFATAVLPSFSDIVSVVDFRAVFKRPVSEYDQENCDDRFLEFTPVVIIQIVRDSGNPESFEFQCEPSDLSLIVKRLQEAKGELEAAKNNLTRKA